MGWVSLRSTHRAFQEKTQIQDLLQHLLRSHHDNWWFKNFMSVPPSVVFLDAIIIVMHDEIIRVIHYTALYWTLAKAKDNRKKKKRPRRDSNPQSSDPKSDALSIRPRGHTRKLLVNCRYVGRPRRYRIQEEVGVGLQSVQEDVNRWWCRCRVYIERLQCAELPLRSFYHWSKRFNTCVHTYTNTSLASSLASQTHFRKRGFARLHRHTHAHSTTL